MVGKPEAVRNSIDQYLGLGTMFCGEGRGESMRETHELIPELGLSAQFVESIDAPGSYSLKFFITIRREDGTTVQDVRIFHNVSRFDEIRECPFEVTDEALEALGFSVSPRVYQSEPGSNTDVEKRFKIERLDTKEKQTVTISSADHWQNSHSHRSFIEQYTLTAGTIKLVEEYGESQFRVVTVTKTETGHHIKEEIVNERGELVESVRDQETGNFTYLATETDKPHNVWASKDAVFGAVTGEVQGEKRDWNPSPEFDERIRRAGL